MHNKKNMKNTIITVIYCQILALLLTCSPAAASKPELQKVRHTVLSSTSEQVTLLLNGSYSPKIFTLEGETPRIIFDFPDMIYGKEIQNNAATKGTIVKRIRVGMHTDTTLKTRIVFDVATLQGVTYNQEFDDKSSTLTIRFTTSAKPAAPGARIKTTTDKNQSKPTDSTKKTADSKTITQTDTIQPESDAKPQPAAQETALKPPVTEEKTEEKKTPFTTTVQAPPEATVDSKTITQTDTIQPESDAKSQPAPQKTVPKTTVTEKKAEEKKTPATKSVQAPPEAIAESKTITKADTVQTESDAKSQPAPQKTTPKPAVTEEKAEGKKTPAPTTALPQPVTSTDTKPSAKTEAVKPAATAGGSIGPLLESVKFDGTSPKGEMVLFKLNDFHPPVIHGVEEGVPRVICEFNSTQIVDSVKNVIKADGKYIKIIRITKHKKPDRIRVVLDLEPNRSYDLQQVFFKEDNLFVIIVNTAKK